MKKLTVAICYDFDKTLASDDMQSFSFIPNLGYTPSEFWKMCRDFTEKYDVDGTLSYLHTMIKECEKRGIKLTKEYLKSLGKDVKFFEGVTTWFRRINNYASKHNINLEHYIISSGNREIIEGSAIFKEFKELFGRKVNNLLYKYFSKDTFSKTFRISLLLTVLHSSINNKPHER